MPRTYRTGKRLQRLQITSYIFFTLEVAFFYLVYLYVLQDSYEQWAGSRLIAIFILVEAVIIVLTRKFFDLYREKVYVVLDDTGVTIHNLLGSHTMRWEEFEAVDHMRIAGRHPCPITFTVSGRSYVPNAYLEDLHQMDRIIVNKIRHRVELPADIDRALEGYKFLKV